MSQSLTSVLDVVRTISICPPQRLINLRKNLLVASPLPGASCRYLVLDNVLFRALCNVLVLSFMMPTAGASEEFDLLTDMPWGSIFFGWNMTKAISVAKVSALAELPYRQNV